jgi:hypothetical protein
MGHTLRILNPVGELNFIPLSPAPRLKDLNHKKIGLYWNHKARGNVALDRVKEKLQERFGGLSFEWFDTAVSAEAPQEWFEDVKKKGVAGVVGATGD